MAAVQILQLEMERLSLAKAAESDRAAKGRLKSLDAQLDLLKREQVCSLAPEVPWTTCWWPSCCV